jgi:hypothetical protein
MDGVDADASLKDQSGFAAAVSAGLPVAAGVSLDAMVADTDRLFGATACRRRPGSRPTAWK